MSRLEAPRTTYRWTIPCLWFLPHTILCTAMDTRFRMAQLKGRRSVWYRHRDLQVSGPPSMHPCSQRTGTCTGSDRPMEMEKIGCSPGLGTFRHSAFSWCSVSWSSCVWCTQCMLLPREWTESCLCCISFGFRTSSRNLASIALPSEVVFWGLLWITHCTTEPEPPKCN